MTDNEQDTKSNERFGARFGRATVWAAIFGGCGVVALAWSSSSYKSEHIPLTERLESAYQQCTAIEDKNQEVQFAEFVYASCKEVEDLYLKVNSK